MLGTTVAYGLSESFRCAVSLIWGEDGLSLSCQDVRCDAHPERHAQSRENSHGLSRTRSCLVPTSGQEWQAMSARLSPTTGSAQIRWRGKVDAALTCECTT